MNIHDLNYVNNHNNNTFLLSSTSFLLLILQQINITIPIINTPNKIKIIAQIGKLFLSSSSGGEGGFGLSSIIVIFKLELIFEIELHRFNLMISLVY